MTYIINIFEKSTAIFDICVTLKLNLAKVITVLCQHGYIWSQINIE